MNNVLIAKARKKYHQELLSNGVLTIDSKGIPSNADSSSKLSIRIAQGIARKLMAEVHEKAVGQTSGAKFEQINMNFLNESFPHLQNLRPGKWHIAKLGNRNAVKTSSFAQYEHLEYLNQLTKSDARLAASMGNDYMVAPDVVIYRETETDETINEQTDIIDNTICKLADIRKSNGGLPILHASISAKWTMRSDRAQNSRTEALGLIRNRKGHLPHIVVVTGEPMPARLASLAMGTGDIDCVYHFALYELIEAVNHGGFANGVLGLAVYIKSQIAIFGNGGDHFMPLSIYRDSSVITSGVIGITVSIVVVEATGSAKAGPRTSGVLNECPKALVIVAFVYTNLHGNGHGRSRIPGIGVCNCQHIVIVTGRTDRHIGVVVFFLKSHSPFRRLIQSSCLAAYRIGIAAFKAILGQQLHFIQTHGTHRLASPKGEGGSYQGGGGHAGC